jgi:hypothetical protein
MLLRWKYPFDDGVVIDTFEIGVVKLPDTFIPVALQEEERDRRVAEALDNGNEPAVADTPAPTPGSGESAHTAGEESDGGGHGGGQGGSEAEAASIAAFAAAAGLILDPDSASVDIDSLEPVVHRTGHRCSFNVTGSLPYTAFRVRVRAHSMVGWGPWGAWSLVTTKGACACACVRVLCRCALSRVYAYVFVHECVYVPSCTSRYRGGGGCVRVMATTLLTPVVCLRPRLCTPVSVSSKPT